MTDVLWGEEKDIDFSLIKFRALAKISGVSTKRVQIGVITSKLVKGERMEGGKNQYKRKQGRTKFMEKTDK